MRRHLLSSAALLASTTLLLPSCKAKTVELSGRVYQGLLQDAVAGGADLAVLSFEGETLGQTTADSDGFFTVEVPEDVNVFVRIDADGAPVTTFAGVVSLFDETLPDYYLYSLPDADVAEVEGWFAGCATGDGPGIVMGEVRHQDLVDRDGDYAINTAGQVKLLLEDGTERTACYLDADGEAYDPDALLVGASGRFAILGVPAGLHTLDVGFDATLQQREVQQYPVLIVDEPSVSPWFPAWVTLPE